jgi:deoxyribodipyrimidine photo-lyase
VPRPSALVWFRRDLRLADNPALRAAKDGGFAVIPVFIWAPGDEGEWPPGAASKWWLHHSLAALDASLVTRGSRLILRTGTARKALRTLLHDTGATTLFWNRRYEPAALNRDMEIEGALRAEGLQVRSFNGGLLREPWEVKTRQREPYQVFTPYWRACCGMEPPAETLPLPRDLQAPSHWPASDRLNHLALLPKIDWDIGFYDRWTPGEEGARAALRSFLRNTIENYHVSRERPAERGTSSLSPHLHFGEISPRQVWEAVTGQYGPPRPQRDGKPSGPMTFLSELGWREFAHHVLHHFPDTPAAPLREKFRGFPWRTRPRELRAWQRGRTGYPIVDAGMRELWATGWMHNRVRMIVGSFLTKDLLIGWEEGAAWFWDTLVDADLANNTFNWQWISGCGADAAPFFRVFNPVTQGEKFDPGGEYVRRWVPELDRLPDNLIHHPWDASDEELERAGVTLGKNYPHPIVDHADARANALKAFESVK